MKIGIADYGMNVWDGAPYDYEERARQLKAIGYEGIERLTAYGAEEAVRKSAVLRKLGMGFATVRGPSAELSLQWTSGLGKDYVWTELGGGTQELEVLCRQVNIMAQNAGRWGIRVALHNHMGTPVETQDQVEYFLNRCPEARLVFDTAHLAATGGDCAALVRKYADRLQVIHVKDWLETDPGNEIWHKRGQFCGLGQGNAGVDNLSILQEAVECGYEGWVFVEHDTHLNEPLDDLASSRDYLRKGGF